MLPKNTQYLLAGAIGLYIVLMTRPAPAVITNLLSSSVAQIAALALVIYVGATQSLIVAVVLAVAVVMSTPSREYMTDVGDKKKPVAATKKPAPKKATDAKKPVESAMKVEGGKATKSAKAPAAKDGSDPKGVSKLNSTEPEAESLKESAPGPKPAGQLAATAEKFSLMNAADF